MAYGDVSKWRAAGGTNSVGLDIQTAAVPTSDFHHLTLDCMLQKRRRSSAWHARHERRDLPLPPGRICNPKLPLSRPRLNMQDELTHQGLAHTCINDVL
jgi:hypothetical protein